MAEDGHNKFVAARALVPVAFPRTAALTDDG